MEEYAEKTKEKRLFSSKEALKGWTKLYKNIIAVMFPLQLHNFGIFCFHSLK